MQDESTPDFVSELCNLYIEVVAQRLDELKETLTASTPDFSAIVLVSNQLMSSSVTLGAKKMAALSDQVIYSQNQGPWSKLQALICTV